MNGRWLLHLARKCIAPTPSAARPSNMFTLQPETLNQIYAHARADFPEECCGVILHADEDRQEFVRQCRNIQNALHEEDPGNYPRDARTAYIMHPEDLGAVHKEAETRQRPIKAFYHSHPNHKAYFSEKDKADAFIKEWDMPAYPGATYVVISVYGSDIRDVKAFSWDETAADFIEVPVQESP